jgi:hypothetical protein
MSNHTALIQDLFANITREGWSTKFNDALAAIEQSDPIVDDEED